MALFSSEPKKATYRGWHNWNDIPSGPCFSCKENEGTVWYSKFPVDYNRHGSDQAWCKDCVIKDIDEKIEGLQRFREKLNGRN